MTEPSSPATPRIQPLPPKGNVQHIQGLLDEAKLDISDKPMNIFDTLAKHAGLFRRWLPFGGKLLQGGKLPHRDRELLILATAFECGSDYEWGQHLRLGALVGLTDDEMVRITAGAEADGWAEPDRELLRAVPELVRDHVLSDRSWDALAARYDEPQLIELTILVGHYAMLAGFLNSARVQREDGVPGFPATAG